MFVLFKSAYFDCDARGKSILSECKTSGMRWRRDKINLQEIVDINCGRNTNSTLAESLHILKQSLI